MFSATVLYVLERFMTICLLKGKSIDVEFGPGFSA
jgi:predicted naringenin-chalcone synthase